MAYQASIILEIPIRKDKERDYLTALSELRHVILRNGHKVIAAEQIGVQCSTKIPFPGYSAHNREGRSHPTMRYFGIALFIEGDLEAAVKDLLFIPFRFTLPSGAIVDFCGVTYPVKDEKRFKVA